MNYDAWKTESGDDYDERMGTHAGEAGRCACGEITQWLTDGQWECDECAAVRMEQQEAKQ